MKKLISAFAYLMLFTSAFAQSYTLTVANGGGDGDYSINDIVTISSDAPPAGQHFVKWTTSDGGSFADPYSPVTTYTMPGNNATVTASFSTYSALISNTENNLTASDRGEGDEFGFCVDIYGDTAVVGAWRDDDNTDVENPIIDVGSAYVFVKSEGIWTQQQKLTPDDGAAEDYFGKSVSIYGDTIVVGANSDDDNGINSGSIYVFTRSGSIWTQAAKLTASDAQPLDYFGTSVFISGNTIVAGSPEKGSPGGSVYVFTGSGTNWTQQAVLTASDAQPNDAFGNAVSISGDTMIIGAHADDDGGTFSGSAYVFVGSGASWTQQAKLTASDAAKFDSFGFSVDISGDTVVVGSRFDDDNGLSSGSAYIFLRSGTSWTQQAKLTASDADENDAFGQAVSISGDSVVVGAYSNDDAGNNSGSTYLFLRNENTWTEQSKYTAEDAAESDSFGSSVAIHGQNTIIGSVNDSGGGSAYTYDLNPGHKLTVINGTGDGIYLAGTVVPIVSDTPPAWASFINWTSYPEEGAIADANAMTTTYTMPANDVEVTSNFAVETYNLTYNAGANGSINGSLFQVVSHGLGGSSVTAEPDIGYHFTGWSDGVLTTSRTDLNITSDLNVTANFAINIYDVTYLSGLGGKINGVSSQNISHGDDASTVTAVPISGYHFVDWSDGVSTASRTDLNITSDLSVTANFAIDTYSLNYTPGPNGAITGVLSQTVYHGSNGTEVTAVPAGNYHFVDWSDGLTTTYRTDLKVTSNLSVTANFAINNYYNVIYDGNENTNGTVPVDSTSYLSDTTVTVSENSGSLTKTGSTFAGWNTAPDGSGTPYSGGATFQIVSDVILYAQWTFNQYTVNYDGNGNTEGLVPAYPDNSFEYGDTVTVLANTGNLIKTGGVFQGWNTAADGSGTPYLPDSNFNMPAANVTLYAQWLEPHSADANGDWIISQSEVESFIALYKSNNNTETTANGDITSGRITMREVMRVIYLHNNNGPYTVAQSTVDGYDVVNNRTVTTDPPGILAAGPGDENPPLINVSSNSDSGIDSLRNAIAFATDGDTIKIDPSLNTIVVLAEIVIDKSITIDGNGVAIVSGDKQTRIFKIENNDRGINVTLKNMGIVDAKNDSDDFGGAVYNNGQTLNLDTVLFDGNANTMENGKGGAVYNSGTLNTDNCIFQNNTASIENDIYTE